jgi:hypothetical protein
MWKWTRAERFWLLAVGCWPLAGGCRACRLSRRLRAARQRLTILINAIHGARRWVSGGSNRITFGYLPLANNAGLVRTYEQRRRAATPRLEPEVLHVSAMLVLLLFSGAS